MNGYPVISRMPAHRTASHVARLVSDSMLLEGESVKLANPSHRRFPPDTSFTRLKLSYTNSADRHRSRRLGIEVLAAQVLPPASSAQAGCRAFRSHR